MRPEANSRTGAGSPARRRRRATSYASTAPMLWPNSASGLSSRWRTAAKISSANSGMLSMPGSWWRI